MTRELPPPGRGTPEEQIAQLRDYLVRLARELEPAGTAAAPARSAARAAAPAAAAEEKAFAELRARADALKALIVKTAHELTVYADEKIEQYNALYVAQSDFGSYYQLIERDVEDTARGAIESYHFTDAIESAADAASGALEAAERYRSELVGQIRRGVMDDPLTGQRHLGIAVSEDLQFTGETVSSGGRTYYALTPGQTLGLYTSTGWQFWINGQLRGYFSSADNRLHVADVVVDESLHFSSGWEITTAGGFGLRYTGG